MKKLLLLLALILCMSSCASVDLPKGDALFTVHGAEFAENESAPVSQIKKEEPIPYTVLYEAPGIERTKHEPPFGCYTAAMLTSGSSLRDFNKETKHAVYIQDVVLGEELPSSWILSCIAAQATPFILLHPNQEAEISIPQINDAAVWLGGYNIPVFVAFSPLSSEMKISAENYKVYYRHARSLFKIQAPLAAMTWLADSEVEDADEYYPGDDVVDWVGFTSHEEDVLGSFENFYMRYQEKKPLMLGPFGVSHFSDEDYSYRIEEASDKITEIYSAVRNLYPRVKMIAYADINLLPLGGGDDYSFSQSSDLAAAYKNATADKYYLTKLSKANGSERSEWIRSADSGYVTDGKPRIEGRNLNEFGAVQPDHARRVLYVYAKSRAYAAN